MSFIQGLVEGADLESQLGDLSVPQKTIGDVINLAEVQDKKSGP